MLFYSLSEYSEENMMDPYNLAICFGPTLVPVPDDKDQVQYQNLINDLIKNVIELHEELFPPEGGPMYEKYISCEPDEKWVSSEAINLNFALTTAVSLTVIWETPRLKIYTMTLIRKCILQRMVNLYYLFTYGI